MNADRGTCISSDPRSALGSAFASGGPAMTPTPVSTSTCPLEPVLDPNRGISLRVEKFRGLRPRTTIGAVVDSAMVIVELSLNVAMTLR